MSGYIENIRIYAEIKYNMKIQLNVFIRRILDFFYTNSELEKNGYVLRIKTLTIMEKIRGCGDAVYATAANGVGTNRILNNRLPQQA